MVYFVEMTDSTLEFRLVIPILHVPFIEFNTNDYTWDLRQAETCLHCFAKSKIWAGVVDEVARSEVSPSLL